MCSPSFGIFEKFPRWLWCANKFDNHCLWGSRIHKSLSVSILSSISIFACVHAYTQAGHFKVPWILLPERRWWSHQSGGVMLYCGKKEPLNLRPNNNHSSHLLRSTRWAQPSHFSGFYLTLKPMHFTLRPFSFPLLLHTFSEVQFNKFAQGKSGWKKWYWCQQTGRLSG